MSTSLDTLGRSSTGSPAPATNIGASYPDRVELYIPEGGQPVPMKSYTYTQDLFESCASFTAEIDPSYIHTSGLQRNEFTFKVNGETVIKGFLDKVEINYDKESYSQIVHGRDYAAILVDNYILKFKAYLRGSVSSIIDNVWANSNSVSKLDQRGWPKAMISSVSATVNPPLKLPVLNFIYSNEALNKLAPVGSALSNTVQGVKATVGQTLHDFISNLLNQYGCYYYNEPGTNNIIIHATNVNGHSYDLHPVSTLANGSVDLRSAQSSEFFYAGPINPDPLERILSGQFVEKASFTKDYADYHPYIKLIGQVDADNIESSGTKESIETGNTQIINTPYKTEWLSMRSKAGKETINTANINLANMQRFYVADVNSATADVWNHNAYSMLNNKRISQLRKLMKLKYTVHTHNVNGKNYAVNKLYRVMDERFQLNDDFLLQRVTMRGSKAEGQKTELEFSPALYANDPPETALTTPEGML